MWKSRLRASFLIIMMLFTSVIPTYAEVLSETTQSTAGTAETTVSAEIGSYFVVKVPKIVKLDKSTKSCQFVTYVSGDIPGDKTVTVIPDATFSMKQSSKEDITANVMQTKTTFTSAELLAANGKFVETTGTIAAPDLTGGHWRGTFNFNVSCDAPGVDPTKITLNDFEYYTTSATGVIHLSKYTGTATDVTVPSKIADSDGYEYTTEVEMNCFSDTGITSVCFEKGTKLSSIASGMFSGCTKLQTADLSTADMNNCKTISRMFDGCTSLTSVNFGENTLPKLTDTSGTFNNCKALTSLDISRWNMSNLTSDKTMLQYCLKLTDLKLPETVNRIDNFMFNHLESLAGNTFTLPKGIEYIGDTHIFYNCGTSVFRNFVQQEDSDVYKVVNGILYSADGTRLISVPKGQNWGGTNSCKIPEGATDFNGLCFSKNYNIITMTFPNSFVIKDDQKDAVGNKGSNLNIGIYRYTSTYIYAVNDDNPNYTAVAGVIYNKNKTELMAVPTHYQGWARTPGSKARDGALIIPEGVTTIHKDALYADCWQSISELKSISIPATLTTIPDDQFTVINNLAGTGRVTITVADGNTSFEVVNNRLVRK